MEERRAGGDAARLPRLAKEIVARRPDAIACTGGTEAGALQAATREIPIVFMQVAVDPVAAGLVESISRPGGNVTGFLQAPQLLSGKRLDILAETSRTATSPPRLRGESGKRERCTIMDRWRRCSGKGWCGRFSALM